MRFLFPVALFMSTFSFGQVSSPRNAYPVKESHARQPHTKTSSISAVDFSTAASCDSMIASLDKRIASVRSNPESNAKALENGWFDRMATLRATFASRKEELLKPEND